MPSRRTMVRVPRPTLLGVVTRSRQTRGAYPDPVARKVPSSSNELQLAAHQVRRRQEVLDHERVRNVHAGTAPVGRRPEIDPLPPGPPCGLFGDRLAELPALRGIDVVLRPGDPIGPLKAARGRRRVRVIRHPRQECGRRCASRHGHVPQEAHARGKGESVVGHEPQATVDQVRRAAVVQDRIVRVDVAILRVMVAGVDPRPGYRTIGTGGAVARWRHSAGADAA